MPTLFLSPLCVLIRLFRRRTAFVTALKLTSKDVVSSADGSIYAVGISGREQRHIMATYGNMIQLVTLPMKK